MDPLLMGTTSAFGLAASAGLNTTVPLLVVGLLARFGLLTLAAPFDALMSDVALGGLLLLSAVEVVSDKVPGWDSVVQTVQWPLAAAAGAILFASQTSVVSEVTPGLAILVGLLTSGGVHAVRAAARPLVTAGTFGVGNPVVSMVEDLFAVLLTVLSIIAPVLALVLLALLVLVLAGAARWLVRHGTRLLNPGRSRTANPMNVR